MDLQWVIETLESKDTYGARSMEPLPIPFAVSPEEYLSYAEKDLAIGDKQHLIGALSNAKRSLDCQVELLLMGLRLHTKAKRERMSVPSKLTLINQIGIVAPRILNKLNRMRNLIEHEFSAPSTEAVEDFVDAVSLFLFGTRMFIREFPVSCEFFNEVSDISGLIGKHSYVITGTFVDNGLKIDAWQQHFGSCEFVIDADDKNYPRLVRAYLKDSTLK